MRLWTWALVVWVPTLLAAPAAAQSTEDGIRALLGGDYETAARILRPLADGAARPDPAAQFFLALLYANGQGVPHDEPRACGLFQQAASRANPFSEAAAALAAFMREQFGSAASLICVGGDTGPDHRPRPTLGANDQPVAASRRISAQASTADGVAALTRGEYRRAADILKPIAEDSHADDTAAQFFMAGLYGRGRGVQVDPLRACALYVRAASKHDNLFGLEALVLLGTFDAQGLAFNRQCHLLANLGLDNGFEPVTFSLGPGHFVEWTLGAVTVKFDGRARRIEVPFEFSSARFLPFRHTELATGPARSHPRHFMEMFVWEPSGEPGPWHLRWHVFEVVRDEIIRIDTPESVATVTGDAPPSRDTFDVRDYAVLRADTDGNAEWAVLKGQDALRHRIESDAERREIHDKALARAADLKRVDWSRRLDEYRRPSMTYIDADGCGRVQVYGWTADRAEAVVVRAAVPEPGSSATSLSFDLAREPVNLSVEAHVYGRPQGQFDFCSDVKAPRAAGSIEPETWRAISGTVTIELSAPGVRVREPHLRRATVTLTNVVLQNASGATATMSGPVKLTAIVGRLFG